MQFTGPQVLGFVALLAGTALVGTSLGTSYWTQTKQFAGVESHRGLWEICGSGFGLSGCDNRFKKLQNQIQNQESPQKIQDVMEPYEWACFLLMCISAFLSILSLLSSPCCCNRCGGCLSFTVFVACLCTSATIGTWAYMLKQEQKMIGDFAWSYWLAVAGGALQLVSALLFGVSRVKERYNYSQSI